MKKITTAVILLLFAHYLWGQGIWTAKDRSFLLEGLRNTRSELLSEIELLREDQMSFKPDPDSWSIAEIVEHLGVYEEHLYWDLLYQQHSPERPELVEKVKGNDEALLAYATDPAKGAAPWLAEPIGRFEGKAALIRYFTRFRDEVISLIEETNKDFRLHFIFRAPTNSIWDVRDLHQYTLVWIAHTERHLDQVRRVKAHDHYPK